MWDQQHEEGSEKSKKQHANKIDHTYIDFSQHDTPSPSIDRTGRKKFPTKLHEIVSNPEYQHIIGWLPHGRSWAIFNKKLLVDVCANHFAHDKFDSFNRQVNGWGFKV